MKNRSITLIDNVFTNNNNNLIFKSGIIISNISDHYPII